MKKIIIYESKSGTAKKCADLLAQKCDNVETYDITSGTPDISSYEKIIFGGAYYASSYGKHLKKFIKSNKEELMNKKYYFYVCCADEKNFKKVLINNIGQDVYEKARFATCLGHEVRPDRAKGINRFILKIMKKLYQKNKKPLEQLHEDKIDLLAEKIKD